MPRFASFLRRVAIAFAVVLVYAGVTVTYSLIARTATLGNCGPRWGVACDGGRVALMAGLLALVFGGILLGWTMSLPGRTGPAAGAASVAFVYGVFAASGGFVTGIVVADAPVFWKAMLGVFAVVPLLLLWAGVNSLREKGGARRLFWYLDVSELRYERPTYEPYKDDRTFRVVPVAEDGARIRALGAVYGVCALLGVVAGWAYVAAVG